VCVLVGDRFVASVFDSVRHIVFNDLMTPLTDVGKGEAGRRGTGSGNGKTANRKKYKEGQGNKMMGTKGMGKNGGKMERLGGKM